MFEDRDPDALARFTDLLGRLKHDLGKYVCFRQRWLDDDADQTQRLDALKADLLATRSGPAGTQDAVSVWGGFADQLCGAEPVGDTRWDVRKDPDGAALFAGMDRIARDLPALAAGRPVDVDQLGHAAAQVSERIRSLHQRARAAHRAARA